MVIRSTPSQETVLLVRQMVRALPACGSWLRPIWLYKAADRRAVGIRTPPRVATAQKEGIKKNLVELASFYASSTRFSTRLSPCCMKSKTPSGERHVL